MKTLNLLSSLFAAACMMAWIPPAMAQGSHGGNGGNAIVCYDSPQKLKITSIDLLDYWEGSAAYPYGAIDLGGPTLSVSEKVYLFISRVQKYESVRAQRYRDYAELLLRNDSKDFLVDQFTVGPIDDDHPLTQPQSPCFKEQFAIQFKDPAPGHRRFQILRSLFENPLTSNDVKAGILLHEIVYRDAILSDQHRSSDGSRRMNYFFASEFGKSGDAADRKDAYDLAGIKYAVGAIATRVEPYGIRILIDQNVKDGEDFYNLKETAYLKVGGFEVRLAAGAEDDQAGSYALVRIRHTQRSNQIVGFHVWNLEWLQLQIGSRQLHSKGLIWGEGYVPVYANGWPKMVPPAEYGIWGGGTQLQIQNLNLECSVSVPIFLSDKGELIGCGIYGNEKGVRIKLPHGQHLDLSPNGYRFIVFHPNHILRAVRGVYGAHITAKLTRGTKIFKTDIFVDETGTKIRKATQAENEKYHLWNSVPSYGRQW